MRAHTHKTIDAVTRDLDGFHFNKAVARIRELTNALEAFTVYGSPPNWVRRESFEAVAVLINPMMPHLAEELWHTLGHDTLIADAPWPQAQADLLIDDTVTIAVQVNGKMRGKIEVAKDAPQDDVQAVALALDTVQAAMQGKEPRKVIVVPNRIVNVVV